MSDTGVGRRKIEWYWALCVLASCLGSSLAAVLISVHLSTASEKSIELQRHQTDLKWCAIVAVMDDNYKKLPPPSDLGKNIAKGMSDLRVQLQCPPALTKENK